MPAVYATTGASVSNSHHCFKKENSNKDPQAEYDAVTGIQQSIDLKAEM
jgi:hypothetical protein